MNESFLPLQAITYLKHAVHVQSESGHLFQEMAVLGLPSSTPTSLDIKLTTFPSLFFFNLAWLLF